MLSGGGCSQVWYVSCSGTGRDVRSNSCWSWTVELLKAFLMVMSWRDTGKGGTDGEKRREGKKAGSLWSICHMYVCYLYEGRRRDSILRPTLTAVWLYLPNNVQKTHTHIPTNRLFVSLMSLMNTIISIWFRLPIIIINLTSSIKHSQSTLQQTKPIINH